MLIKCVKFCVYVIYMQTIKLSMEYLFTKKEVYFTFITLSCTSYLRKLMAHNIFVTVNIMQPNFYEDL